MGTQANLLDLKGRVALVTGAGQGVGRGIALTFAAHNASGVVVNDYVADRAEAVAAEINAGGGRAIAIAGDVSDFDQMHACVARAQRELGVISILVNNAGNAGPDGFGQQWPLFWETQRADWDKFFGVNLYGVMNCCHAVLPPMTAQGYGRVVTIVSDAGRLGEPRLAEYSAAKAGAAGFMRGLARDAGRYGVTANCIALGSIETPMPEEQLKAWLASDRTKAQLSKYVIRRHGRPDDVVAMALLLASEASGWITGQTYPVNGGYSFAV